MELCCLSSCPPSYRLDIAAATGGSGVEGVAAAIIFDCPLPLTAGAAAKAATAAAVLVSSCTGLAGIPLLTEMAGFAGHIFVTGPVAAVNALLFCALGSYLERNREITYD